MNIVNVCVFISFLTGAVSFSASTSAADLPEVTEDKGLVVFYRLSGFKGKAIRFNLNHSEGSLGQLLSDTYIYKYIVYHKVFIFSKDI